MNRKVMGMLGSVLMATVGTVILVAYVKGAEGRALAGEQVVDVYVVDQPVAKGTTAEAVRPLLRTERVPLKVRANGSVRDLAALEGKVAAVDLLPGEQLVDRRFVTPEDAALGGVDVPDGLLQTTIALEAQRALGGNIKPGDTIALTASFAPFDLDGVVSEDGAEQESGTKKTSNSTHLILHKVIVTDVQGGVAPPAEGAEQPAVAPAASDQILVTLALDAPSVERVVFAAEFGTVWLSSEPEDAPEDGTNIQTRGTIYQ